MSDAVILQVLDRILQFSTVTIAAVLLYKQNKAQKEQKEHNTVFKKDVETVKDEVVAVKESTKVVHDLVNSKSVKQEKMIKALAKAEQKVEDAINGNHGIEPAQKQVPKKKK